VLAVRPGSGAGDWLERPLAAITVWRHPTLAALITHLAAEPAAVAPAVQPAAAQDRLRRANRRGWDGLSPATGGNARGLLAVAAGDGVDAVTEIPADRWDLWDRTTLRTPMRLASSMSARGAFLTAIEEFDPLFFRHGPTRGSQP
jgi:hypothetical protein